MPHLDQHPIERFEKSHSFHRQRRFTRAEAETSPISIFGKPSMDSCTSELTHIFLALGRVESFRSLCCYTNHQPSQPPPCTNENGHPQPKPVQLMFPTIDLSTSLESLLHHSIPTASEASTIMPSNTSPNPTVGGSWASLDVSDSPRHSRRPQHSNPARVSFSLQRYPIRLH